MKVDVFSAPLTNPFDRKFAPLTMFAEMLWPVSLAVPGSFLNDFWRISSKVTVKSSKSSAGIKTPINASLFSMSGNKNAP